MAAVFRRQLPSQLYLFQRNQLILSGAEPDLLPMLQRLFPADIRIAVHKMIVMLMEMRVREMLAQLTVADRLRFLAKIHASLIQRNRIERRQHAKIRQNRRVVFAVAVAVR